MSISSFIENTLSELFERINQLWQVYKQKRETFYTLNDVCLQNVPKRISCVVSMRASFVKRCFFINLLSISCLKCVV